MTCHGGGGSRYLEKDWGTTFPPRWLWLQCNVFKQGAREASEAERRGGSASLLLSIAELPLPTPQLPLTSFEGLLALLWIPTSHGGEGGNGMATAVAAPEGLWRFTTYNGGRIAAREVDRLGGTARVVLRVSEPSAALSQPR